MILIKLFNIVVGWWGTFCKVLFYVNKKPSVISNILQAKKSCNLNIYFKFDDS